MGRPEGYANPAVFPVLAGKIKTIHDLLLRFRIRLGYQSRRLRFQFLRKLLPKFGYLRADQIGAIRLGRISDKIFLMIVFGDKKGGGGYNLGDDRPVEYLVLGQRLNRGLGRGLLLRRMVKNCGTILGADIIALAIEGGRVMDAEKDFQKFSIGNDGGIKCQVNDFGMSGGAAADRFICRMCDAASHVSGFDRLHAVDLVEHRFQAPEAASGQRRRFLRRWHVGICHFRVLNLVQVVSHGSPFPSKA